MLATNIQTDPFLDILDEMRRLHISKGHDYGTDADNTSNLRASQRFGIPPWVGCVLRANDKLSRIESFITKGRLEHESIEDALLDSACYFVLALQFYREKTRVITV